MGRWVVQIPKQDHCAPMNVLRRRGYLRVVLRLPFGRVLLVGRLPL